MATVITEECINCGACEPECPNTAIYQSGVEWELDGQKHPAISNSIFYIVPEKCTECVGFYDHEACAAVCPVDCCVPDPKIPETEDLLIARARKLHPEVEYSADFPSRFRKEGSATQPAPEAEAAGNRAVAEPVVIPPVALAIESAPKPVAETPPAVKLVAAEAPAVPSAKAVPAGRVEKATAPPPPKPTSPEISKSFAGELSGDFESLADDLRRSHEGGSALPIRLLLAISQPLLGALPHAAKQALEMAVGNRRCFSNAGATGLNILLDMIVYPAVLVVLAYFVSSAEVFSNQMNWYIFLGATLATLETAWRLREGIFEAKPADQMTFGSAFYGVLLGPAIQPWARKALARRQQVYKVGFDGFYAGGFDEKLERDRRYGDVYSLEDWGKAYFLRLEFPRALPPSGLKEQLGLPDVLPDYDYDLSITNGSFVIRGRIMDPRVKKLTSVASAFPPEFRTQIGLGSKVQGFKHRYRDKVLEVLLVKKA